MNFAIISTKDFKILKFKKFFIFSNVVGLFLSWPYLVIPVNQKCFKDINLKSPGDKISLKAAFEISSTHLLEGKNKKTVLKLRIVADSCFS